MSVTGTDIRVRTAPTATRAFVLAALLATAVAAGFAIGRGTVPGPATRSQTVETAIPTRWLGDTPAVRTQIMEAVNGLPASSSAIENSPTARAVMRHMNELADRVLVAAAQARWAYQIRSANPPGGAR
jgi:hypothetical protein